MSAPKDARGDDALLAEARTQWAAGRRDAAIVIFRNLAKRRPASSDAIFNLGAALMGVGQTSEATELLQMAVNLRPRFDQALRALAHLKDNQGKETEAAALYRRASVATKSAHEARIDRARALVLEGDTDQAEKELRRAATVAPQDPGVKVILGQILLERGNFQEGEALLVQALEVIPEVFHHVSLSRPVTPSDIPLIERMEVLAQNETLAPFQRGAISFGLGKAYDDLDDPQRAIAHFDVAAQLYGQSRPLDRAGLVARYDANIKAFPAPLEGRHRAIPAPLSAEAERAVLIIGMPRSGTTLVEQIVSSHPDVAAGGELSFWSDRVNGWLTQAETLTVSAMSQPSSQEQLASLLQKAPARSAVERASLQGAGFRPEPPEAPDQAQRSQAVRDYDALLRKIGPDSLRVTDKAPFNFERLGHIRECLPGVRIIHCRRRPIDTCLSLYFTNYKGRQAWSRADILFHYKQYQRLMAHWRSILAGDRFIEIDYEALITDREAQTRRLVAFCELGWDEACLSPQNNRRLVKSASLWQARQPTYKSSLDRWKRYAPWLGAFEALLEPET